MSLSSRSRVGALSAGALVSAAVLVACSGAALGQDLGQDRGGAEAVRPYENHKLVRVPAATRRVLGAIESLEADVWTHTIMPMRPIELRLSPEQYGRFVNLGLAHEVVHENLQAVVDAERARIEARGQRDDLTFYDEYRTLDEYWVRWQQIADINPDVASFGVIGQSLEGRDMPGFRLNGNGESGKPVMLINACQHAREWVSPAAVTFLIEHLVDGYGDDPRITRLLDELEWVFVPMMNPDGFDYTWTDERFWRKNKRIVSGTLRGVDTNRNWSVAWGMPGGSSSDPRSETYHGTGPFSEPELQTFTAWVDGLTDRVAVHLDVHTYGQLVLHPLGYSFEPSEDDSVFQELGDIVAGGIFDTTGATYTAAQGSSGLYATSGSAKDWVYGEFGGNGFGWTIELRPISSGLGGFDPEPDQILPAGRELTEGVLRLAEKMAQPLRFHVTPQVGGAPAGEPSQRLFEVRSGTEQLDPSTVRAYIRVRASAGFHLTPVEHIEGEDYSITFRAMECSDLTDFYVEAATTGGQVYRYPESGSFQHRVSDPVVVMRDACEIAGEWIAGLPDDTAVRGQWNHGDPEETDAQPEDDASADGVNGWFTDTRAGGGIGDFDVDEGFTSLVSPRFDATATGGKVNPEPYVSFALWFSNDQGSAAGEDEFTVLISNNDGGSWELLEATQQSTNGWETRRYFIADYLEPTSQMRLKFIVADEDRGSIVEAGIDELMLEVDCGPPHPADLDRDGALTIFDFLLFQGMWEWGEPGADLDGDGLFTIFDFLAYQTLFES